MTARELRGRPVARDILQSAREEIESLRDEFAIVPSLCIVQIGDDPSSAAYARSILRACDRVAIDASRIEMPTSTTEPELEELIEELNCRPDVHGIIVMQPMPDHLDRLRIASLITPIKDIDGMASANAGKLMLGDEEAFAPSTPAGGMELLRHYEIPISGRHAVVIGRSPVVGLPMALMLLAEDATISIAHSRTVDLPELTRQADILVCAVGHAGLVTADMVQQGATVVDFGVNVIDGALVGDVDYAAVAEVAGSITPVPGGTGTVTTAILVRNTVSAAKRLLQSSNS